MRKSLLFIAGLLFAFTATAQTVTVTDNGGAGTGTTTWTANNTYLLDGFVYVNSGDTLTIEAGTVIKGLPGQGADASALVVARGATIMAMGTKDNPIIMTGSTDDVANPFDVPLNTTGLWGGFIVLGNASLNSAPGETAIEGIPVGEPRGLYGAIDPNNDGDYSDAITNDDDNSGVIQYVSIRHGGTDIGAGNEINGFTLGGVGSATTIDHVEVIFNADDGVEFFGGLPNAKNLSVAFVGDDSFDYDEGYRGKGQFWFTIQSDDASSDRAGEHDGGTSPETAQPYATPTIYNATYIGRGIGSGKRLLTFRDNAGGVYANSIFAEQDKGVDVEILGNGDDSYDRFVAGDLELKNNVFSNVGGTLFDISAAKYSGVSASDSTMEVDAAKTDFAAYFATAGNVDNDAGFVSLSYTNDNQLDPRPQSGITLSDFADLPMGDTFFEQVSYKGAFSPAGGEFWLTGWSYLDFLGYFPTSFPQTVSIGEDLEPLYISVFPNPSNGTFFVEASDLNAQEVSIRVLTLTGSEVYNGTANTVGGFVRSEINLTNVPAALYIVELRAGNKYSLQRLVIE